ncbi:hypothetical protein B296_00038245 [Ensete ventricosum]|uniref:Uncharacterized protein n=1 Tax=Ensete ventricosum TaxID=4639 RepID=A0A426YGT8_ENSVE|nr:hypothetical protein B296_00038245 [Ensete ventricosum]
MRAVIKRSPYEEKEKRKLKLKGGNKTKGMKERGLTQMADLLALFISSSEEHSYACFTKVGCKAPSMYSQDSGPSVQNWVDPAMADHLGIRGLQPSATFNRVMIVANYLFAPTRFSTSHSSQRV